MLARLREVHDRVLNVLKVLAQLAELGDLDVRVGGRVVRLGGKVSLVS